MFVDEQAKKIIGAKTYDVRSNTGLPKDFFLATKLPQSPDKVGI